MIDYPIVLRVKIKRRIADFKKQMKTRTYCDCGFEMDWVDDMEKDIQELITEAEKPSSAWGFCGPTLETEE